jgi:hypothetical protein
MLNLSIETTLVYSYSFEMESHFSVLDIDVNLFLFLYVDHNADTHQLSGNMETFPLE